MRRLLVLAFGGAFALAGMAPVLEASAPTVQSAPATVGVSLRDGVGYAAISRRGSLLARVGWGRIRVIDLPGRSRPNVSCDRDGHRVSNRAVVYRGRAVSCRVFGGPWRVHMQGRNIDADGVLVGYLTLDREGRSGRYSIDGNGYGPWPMARTKFRLAGD